MIYNTNMLYTNILLTLALPVMEERLPDGNRSVGRSSSLAVSVFSLCRVCVALLCEASVFPSSQALTLLVSPDNVETRRNVALSLALVSSPLFYHQWCVCTSLLETMLSFFFSSSFF